MSLIFRITIAYFIISLAVFAVGGIITYQVMKREIDAEQRRFLLERETQVTRIINRRINRQLPNRAVTRPKLIITPLADTVAIRTVAFSDTLVMHSTLERIEPHLKLTVEKNVSGRGFRIELYDVIVESDDIVDGVVESLLVMYLILSGAVLILAFLISFFLLRPFRETLEVIKNFSLRDPVKRKLPKTGVSEFKNLNLFLDKMMEKMRKDYSALKEFSENASHEMQTPVAVALGKLDNLLIAGEYQENQIDLITSAQSALNRLKKLGNALSLLTKIDNQEFKKDEVEIDFSEIVENMIQDFDEIVDIKNIALKSQIESGRKVKGNKVLLEILCTNLLNNAVRHNHSGGEIHIELNGGLKVWNTGAEKELNGNDLFQRFKSNGSTESLGLGLAIAKKISDYHKFQLSYEFKDKGHEFGVMFN